MMWSSTEIRREAGEMKVEMVSLNKGPPQREETLASLARGVRRWIVKGHLWGEKHE